MGIACRLCAVTWHNVAGCNQARPVRTTKRLAHAHLRAGPERRQAAAPGIPGAAAVHAGWLSHFRKPAWCHTEGVLGVAGLVKWRLEYRHAASPAARLLQPRSSDPVGVFALLGRVGRSPRVFAFRDREQLLRQMVAAGSKKMGLALTGEACTVCSA